MRPEVRKDHGADTGVFDRRDELRQAHHEQVVFCHDRETDLRAIIGLHDRTRGPALGGTRFFPYRTEAEALTDVLRLSQGMTHKAAAADLPLGGGKAVIIGDPARIKAPQLLEAYGRFIESLGGRYITAADVGTTSDDLDVIGRTTSYVVGRNAAAGGSGDSGPSTALGVFTALRTAAVRLWGDDALTGQVVGVEGAGKVGLHLVGLLLEAGAAVRVSDPHPAARTRVRDLYPSVRLVDSARERVDIYAPCALGGTLDQHGIASLDARLVCGAANNQLATAADSQRLADREITWIPDYVANAGGLVQVGGEALGHDPAEVRAGIERIGDTVRELLDRSEAGGTTPATAAAEIVADRLRLNPTTQ